MLVDAHCHLDFKDFDKDRDEVVKRAKDMIIINSIVDPDDAEKGFQIARRYENVYCTLGLSPAQTDDIKFEKTLELIKKHKDEIVGIGEVGLDYYWVKELEVRKKQMEHFSKFIKISTDIGKPLILHTRDAEQECMDTIAEKKVTALMHCFSGTVQQALNAVEAGCIISIPTNVTYVKARQKLAEAIPLESMVLETDAPYLSPQKGNRNEPSNIAAAAKKIAELKGENTSTVEDTTSENALRFYNIENG